MTSRLSYASSPESDLELSPAPSLPGTLGVPSRLKSSSDPSIATQDDAVAPPPYTTSYQVSQLLHSPSAEQQRAVAAAAVAFQAAEGLLPQHRRTRSHQPQQHHPQQQQQQHHSQQQQQQQGPPQLPPRVDRNSKPTGSYDSMSSYDSYNTNGTMAYPNSANLGPSSNPSNPGRLGPNVPDDLKSSNMAMLSRPHDPYKFTRSTAIPVQESQTRTDYAKYSRTGDYKSVPAPPSKSSGTYKPVPPPKPKNYRPPQQPIIQDENSGNSYQHAKSYSMGTPHMMNGAENGVNMQRNNNNNNNQYYYNIISPSNRNMQNSDGYSVNSNHAHNHMNTNAGSHNHSISHSHPLSSSSMLSHSHSSSSGQIGVAHSHSRSNVTMNGHSHSNSHSGISLQNSIVNNSNSSNHTNGNSNIHNRESSTLDLAGSREQRGSAFELYRKPLHHHNIRTMGMARGVFGNEGGVLEGPGGVTMIIPPGALPPNIHREIYFSVTDANELYSNTRGHRSSISPPMHNGESMLSPLVECGPKGLEFQAPVELRIPHNATPAHRLALKATDTENNSSADWLNVKLPDPTSDHIIVRLDHF